MSRDDVLAWLRSKDMDTFDLPNLVKEEIRRVLVRYSGQRA